MKTELDYARQLADLIEEIRKAPDGNFSGDGEVWVGPFVVCFGYSDDDPVTIYRYVKGKSEVIPRHAD